MVGGWVKNGRFRRYVIMQWPPSGNFDKCSLFVSWPSLNFFRKVQSDEPKFVHLQKNVTINLYISAWKYLFCLEIMNVLRLEMLLLVLVFLSFTL